VEPKAKISLFEKTLKKPVKHAIDKAKLNFGIAYVYVNERRWSKAMKYLQQAVELDNQFIGMFMFVCFLFMIVFIYVYVCFYSLCLCLFLFSSCLFLFMFM